MTGPDFFIVGAPKSGTTALANYLGQHPEVGMCAFKETHYFAVDLRGRVALRRHRGERRLEEYLGYFADVAGKPRLGEASVWYLYSPGAAEEIRRFRPDAQIVVMLRDPVEMLHALHSEFVLQQIEPVEDFAEAFALDGERLRQGTPRGFPPHSYRAAIRYGEQLERYLEAFGRERVHVIVYEEFREDPLGAFRDTCEFLRVDPDFSPAMPVVNANRKVRNRRLQRLVRRPPESVRTVLHAVTTQGMRRRAGTRLLTLNRRFEPRDPLPASVADALRPDVEREVAALRALLGLDVSRWLESRPVPLSEAR